MNSREHMLCTLNHEKPDEPRTIAEGLYNRNLVLRVKGGVLDMLPGEAYREGYDDSRYIATLMAVGGEEWLEAQPQERILRGRLVHCLSSIWTARRLWVGRCRSSGRVVLRYCCSTL